MEDEIGIDFKIHQDILEMAKQLNSLLKEAVSLIEPEVEAAINGRIADSHHIELLLDRLLDYAGMDDDGLALFNRMCRYYYSINPVATTEYMNTYRDMYGRDADDADDDNENEAISN